MKPRVGEEREVIRVRVAREARRPRDGGKDSDASGVDREGEQEATRARVWSKPSLGAFEHRARASRTGPVASGFGAHRAHATTRFAIDGARAAFKAACPALKGARVALKGACAALKAERVALKGACAALKAERVALKGACAALKAERVALNAARVMPPAHASVRPRSVRTSLCIRNGRAVHRSSRIARVQAAFSRTKQQARTWHVTCTEGRDDAV